MEIKNIAVKRMSDMDKKLEMAQKPILEKLEEKGYSLYIEKDFYMPIPNIIYENNFPIELYDSHADAKIIVNNWNELSKLVK